MRVAILAPVHLAGLQKHLSLQGLEGTLPGGMGGYCINALIEARLRRGWKTDVVTLDAGVKDDIARFKGPLLRIWVVRRGATKAIRRLFTAERERILVALDEAKPDVLHVNWTYEYGLAAVRQSRYPYVITVHDHALNCLRWLGWRYWPLYLISQYVLRRSRHVTAVSPYVAGYLEGVLQRPVTMIPNFIPESVLEIGRTKSWVSSAGIKDGRCGLIVSAISWSELKNVRRALHAFRLARQFIVQKGGNLRYILLGPGLGVGGEAEQWARDAGCAQGVSFMGVVTHAEAIQVMAEADVLLHPSHEEAMPGPVCEAMAMRIPVVACREAGGCRWLCDDDRGLLCDGYNVRDMADRIVEAYTLPQLRRCDTAIRWLLELIREEKLLDALSLTYSRALSTST